MAPVEFLSNQMDKEKREATLTVFVDPSLERFDCLKILMERYRAVLRHSSTIHYLLRCLETAYVPDVVPRAEGRPCTSYNIPLSYLR